MHISLHGVDNLSIVAVHPESGNAVTIEIETSSGPAQMTLFNLAPAMIDRLIVALGPPDHVYKRGGDHADV